MTDTIDAVRAFDEQRPVMFGVAYRILGRVADAEDVVQEAWLRWSSVDAAEIRDPRAFLVRVAGRLAIDRLRRIKARAETYVGPWLPEPLPTGGDLEARAELRDLVSMAMLVVLETLSPLERTVFVLREAFDLPYGEVAEIVGRSEPAVRQLARRAREHVDERRPRFEVDRSTHEAITRRFFETALAGDLDGLVAMLAPDARFVSDGGGKVSAARVPIDGAERVAAFVLGVQRLPIAAPSIRAVEINGAPGFVAFSGETPIWAFSVDVLDGRVARVFAVGNPDKLVHLGSLEPGEPIVLAAKR